MTVTPIHRRRGRAVGTISDDDGWTLTLDLRVSGATDPAVLGLVADLRRLIDRSSPASADAGVLRIDVPARTVHLGGRPIALSRLEFNLLLFLAEHPGRVHTRERLLAAVWGEQTSGTRTVDVHVRRIRAKVDDVPVISTVRSVGYRLATDARVRIVH
ncbi:MAG TPA: winged helix-turn-helix domain-containing protein [Micromonosporaceae bacterium]|jgi:DNA-binding response OmpR family regulator